MTSHVDTFDTRPRCIGGCRKVVLASGMVCSSCLNKKARQSDPLRPEPVKDSHQIREEILRNAYILKFGTEAQQDAALETLSHLTFVLKHSQTNP